jgi:hypothetical protein
MSYNRFDLLSASFHRYDYLSDNVTTIGSDSGLFATPTFSVALELPSLEAPNGLSLTNPTDIALYQLYFANPAFDFTGRYSNFLVANIHMVNIVGCSMDE